MFIVSRLYLLLHSVPLTLPRIFWLIPGCPAGLEEPLSHLPATSPGVSPPPSVKQLLTPLLSLWESQFHLLSLPSSQINRGRGQHDPPLGSLLLTSALPYPSPLPCSFHSCPGHYPSLLNVSLLQALPSHLSCYKEPARLMILSTVLTSRLCQQLPNSGQIRAGSL